MATPGPLLFRPCLAPIIFACRRLAIVGLACRLVYLSAPTEAAGWPRGLGITAAILVAFPTAEVNVDAGVVDHVPPLHEIALLANRVGDGMQLLAMHGPMLLAAELPLPLAGLRARFLLRAQDPFTPGDHEEH
jgi:hypothetical protein